MWQATHITDDPIAVKFENEPLVCRENMTEQADAAMRPCEFFIPYDKVERNMQKKMFSLMVSLRPSIKPDAISGSQVFHIYYQIGPRLTQAESQTTNLHVSYVTTL